MNLSKLLASTYRFLQDEDGPTAVEYAVVLALILLAVMGSILVLANNTKDSFDASGDAIGGAFGS